MATFFSNTLLNNFQDNSNKYVKLNDAEINYIGDIVEEYPEILDKIVNGLVDIMAIKEKGEVILDYHDILDILLMIARVYNSNKIGKNLVTFNAESNVDLVNVIQYTLETILYSDIPFTDIDNTRPIKKQVDLYIELLRMNVTNEPLVKVEKKEEGCCC